VGERVSTKKIAPKTQSNGDSSLDLAGENRDRREEMFGLGSVKKRKITKEVQSRGSSWKIVDCEQQCFARGKHRAKKKNESLKNVAASRRASRAESLRREPQQTRAERHQARTHYLNLPRLILEPE